MSSLPSLPVFMFAALLAYLALPMILSHSSSSSSEESSSSSDEPKVYYGVKDGCKLITCTNGTYCAVRNDSMVKMGRRPFARMFYPKCISSPDQLNSDTDPDGNAHVQVNGPGCQQVACSAGYQCQVRVSTVKVGDFPYAQSLGGFPSCVAANGSASSGTGSSPSSMIPNGPGCNLVANCSSGCVSATGIGKYGFLSYEQYFWPMCS